MPLYEIELEDGRIAEIDADSEQAALSAVQNLGPAKPKYNAGLQGARAALQGLTFGLSDEAGAALAAIPASIKTGKPYKEIYSEIQRDLGGKRQAFAEDNPATALGLEIAGGVATGGLGGTRALSGAGYRNASNLGKAGRIAGVGAAEGGIYGAGTADQGERLAGGATGAATGAVAAPVGAGLVNTLGRGAGTLTNYASQKLSQTPRDKAVNVLRNTAESVGMTPDDAVMRMRELGPEATIADLNDAFAVTARAGMNRQGGMREAGRAMVDQRQANQQTRLKSAIASATKGDADFRGTYDNILSTRKANADRLYSQARNEGLRMTPVIQNLLKKPQVAAAYKQGQQWAEGRGMGSNLLEVLHQTKLVLDDRISKAIRSGKNNQASVLKGLQRHLLDEMDANTTYKQAREQFAGDTAAADAIQLGNDFLKKNPEELAGLMNNMTQTERDLVAVGAAKALGDKLDSMAGNRNATRALIGSKVMRDRLGLIMDDPEAFLRQAGIEEQFSGTRQTLTGNSTTAMQQQAGEFLDQALDPGLRNAISNANPQSIIAGIVDTFTRDTATPDMINELGNLMFRRGMSGEEVRAIFTSPRIRQVLGDQYDEVVAPYVRGGIAPAALAAQANSQ